MKHADWWATLAFLTLVAAYVYVRGFHPLLVATQRSSAMRTCAEESKAVGADVNDRLAEERLEDFKNDIRSTRASADYRKLYIAMEGAYARCMYLQGLDP